MMATSQTAAQFRLDLQAAFSEEVESTVLLITRHLALQALNGVVLKSPVDTGRFRANWNVSFGTQNLSTSTKTDKSGQETIAAGRTMIDSLTQLNVVWLSNNLPYANRLENGWSKQAPNGMVNLTFAELQAQINGGSL